MAEETSNQKPKIKKHRSPNYPYLALKEALEKTETLRKTGGIHAVGFKTAMDVWGLKEGTSSSVTAALKAFGLVDVTGEGKNRQLTVTEPARKILADHSDRDELVKRAALSPKLYADLWTKFGPELPPTVKPIREHLLFEKHFNENVVDDVIADFLATIAYAKLSESDKLDTSVEEEKEEAEQPTVIDRTDSGAKVRKAMEFVPQNSLFKASIELNKQGVLDVVFAGSMDSVTMPMLNELFQLKEKYQALIKKPSEPDQGSDSD